MKYNLKHRIMLRFSPNNSYVHYRYVLRSYVPDTDQVHRVRRLALRCSRHSMLLHRVTALIHFDAFNIATNLLRI